MPLLQLHLTMLKFNRQILFRLDRIAQRKSRQEAKGDSSKPNLKW